MPFICLLLLSIIYLLRIYEVSFFFQHDLSNRKATVVSTIAKKLKAIIMVIQAFKSFEILKLFNDIKAIEKRMSIKGK